MSDGPHRSLNMRPHWKVTARWAANLAHTDDEVCGALTHALKKDILEAPIAAVREIMNSDTLFPGMRIEQLEALRARHPRSAATNSLIDCAIEAAAGGVIGEAGTAGALSAALEDIARAPLRGIDEHYQREAGARTSGTVRTRLDDASESWIAAALRESCLSLPVRLRGVEWSCHVRPVSTKGRPYDGRCLRDPRADTRHRRRPFRAGATREVGI